MILIIIVKTIIKTIMIVLMKIVRASSNIEQNKYKPMRNCVFDTLVHFRISFIKTRWLKNLKKIGCNKNTNETIQNKRKEDKMK